MRIDERHPFSGCGVPYRAQYYLCFGFRGGASRKEAKQNTASCTGSCTGRPAGEEPARIRIRESPFARVSLSLSFSILLRVYEALPLLRPHHACKCVPDARVRSHPLKYSVRNPCSPCASFVPIPVLGISDGIRRSAPLFRHHGS